MRELAAMSTYVRVDLGNGISSSAYLASLVL